jgi:acylphosphatase
MEADDNAAEADAPAGDGASGDGAYARLTARAEGRVQGVGFRVAVLRQASRLGLTGWAANLEDGSVEVVAEGPRARCQELLAWLEGGGTPGRVRRVTHRLGAPLGGLCGFSAR